MDTGSRKAIIAAFLANLGIAIGKFVGFLATGATSMLAEAIHSVADTANQGLLMWGGMHASRPPTEEHPFGFARVRYFWSFVVALVLFTLGGLFATWEGIEKLRHPHEISSPGWAIGILLAGILMEGFSLRTAVRAASPRRRGRSWWRFIRLSKNPELPVVLLEDTGALLGLVFALLGVTLAAVTGNPRFDAMGSLVIGILLIAIAVVLMIEMQGLLIGEAAEPEVRRKLREALEGDDSVVRVLDMRTEHLGPEQLLVGARVEFAAGLSTRGVAEAIDAAQERMRRAAPIATTIYLEPELRVETRP